MPITRREWIAGGLALGGALASPPAFSQALLDRAALVRALRGGGFILLHRDTDRMRSSEPAALPGTLDEGHRLSVEGERQAKGFGENYRRLNIPVGEVLSSEVFYLYQTARAAFGERVSANAALTRAMEFANEAEFERSVAGIRALVAAPPPLGSNRVLFTHRSKVEAAFGYYIYPGEIILFQPDPSARRPNLVSVLSPKEFLDLPSAA